MFEDNSYKAHDVHNDLYEVLQKSLELDYLNQHLADQEEARKKRSDVPRTPYGSTPSQPPPLPALPGTSGALGTLGASWSSQLPPSPPSSIYWYIWICSAKRQKSSKFFQDGSLNITIYGLDYI
ncbi:hypothetical protein Tco_0763084 [Tanacetum coccineum]